MSLTDENTTVVIVGSGVAGLALGNFLLRSGIDCVVLERQSREYVEQRQRAGVIDPRAARMFRGRGLEDRVLDGAPFAPVLNFSLDGEARPFRYMTDDHVDGRFCPQQVLVRNLIDVFVSDGGDLRFEAEDVELQDITGPRPRVRYRDSTGVTRTLACDFIAGCDGDHGVSRASIPDNVLTRHAHEYGYAWLTVLADAPANHQSMMAIHDRGFAGQFARGPQASRFYLQCPLDTTVEEWTDDRIWEEIEARFGEPVTMKGPVTSKTLVPLRSVVHDPMSHGRLYLLGDAAHIVPPMSAKGMNLALHDADVFATAVLKQVKEQDTGPLAAYSATCLKHVWNYQAYAAWFTDLMHDAGDVSYRGEFRRRLARAEFERLYDSETANRLFGEFLTGLN
ncbi:4-hydroxybenzoate 3-monooxygenase [Streptomyces spectabilis]|uniref:4-hydroxybenzoate 3-monooxygenase n=1 Tax=Streptomyces spectabilis TaxID=68270 RepID=A0A516RJU7_STRST|nr:4-hydroxybenzoate 3-monooxygenase [Streptomyces spectabilis]QDQ15931.1 4-hydroxybenzoate 3-monooxygenase [Streptomyces spectabilis]